MKVLSFGHIPTSVGGRQSSGLANVIYQLALHIAKQEGYEMTLAATDVFVLKQRRGELTILGWTKKLLLKYTLLHICTSLKVAYNVIESKRKYRALVSVPGLFLKSMFLDYAIRKTCPDIIHLHGAHSVLYQHLIPKRTKIVVTLHGNVGNDKNLPFHEIHAKMERFLCFSQRIDFMCTISSTIPVILKRMYGEIKSKYKVILNAYDNTVFKYIEPIKHDKLTLCTIASFSKLKGQERVIDALKKSGCDYKYRCIGHITDSEKALLDEKAYNIDFEWLGVKKPTEIRDILAECDYMILPSSSEGFGLVYLEAIACGVPIIIPKELPLSLEGNILNGENAIRINGCDINAITEVLPSLKDKKWDSHAVAQSVISYTWDNISKEYCEVYSSLIHNKI